MKLKHSILSTMITAFLFVSATQIADATIVPTKPMPNMSQTLDGSYGLGATDGTMQYFLDPSSYYINVFGDTAHAGATIYIVDKSKPAPGLAANVVQANVNYLYFRNGSESKVLVKSIVTKGGKDITKETLSNDGGFLYQLFWQIADVTGKSQAIAPRIR